jgi:hypothetical protein
MVRHPARALALAATPLAALCAVANSVRIHTALPQLVPRHSESADAYEVLQRSGRSSLLGAMRMVVPFAADAPLFSAAGWARLGSLTREVAAVPGVASARSLATVGTGALQVARLVLPGPLKDAYATPDGRWAVIDVLPDLAHADPLLVAERLERVEAGRFPAAMSGLPSFALDYARSVDKALVRVVLAACVGALAVLLAAFRGVLVACKAVALNLLVSVAALGVVGIMHGVPVNALGCRRRSPSWCSSSRLQSAWTTNCSCWRRYRSDDERECRMSRRSNRRCTTPQRSSGAVRC